MGIGSIAKYRPISGNIGQYRKYRDMWPQSGATWAVTASVVVLAARGHPQLRARRSPRDSDEENFSSNLPELACSNQVWRSEIAENALTIDVIAKYRQISPNIGTTILRKEYWRGGIDADALRACRVGWCPMSGPSGATHRTHASSDRALLRVLVTAHTDRRATLVPP